MSRYISNVIYGLALAVMSATLAKCQEAKIYSFLAPENARCTVTPIGITNNENGLLYVPEKQYNKRVVKVGDGVGYLLSHDLVLTVNHIVRRTNEINVNYENNEIQALVQERDEVNDLAVLKLSKPQNLESIVKVGGPAEIGQKALVHTINPIYKKSNASTQLISSAKITKDEHLIKLNHDVYEVYLRLINGTSGSPIFDVTGNLIGIVSGGGHSHSITGVALGFELMPVDIAEDTNFHRRDGNMWMNEFFVTSPRTSEIVDFLKRYCKRN